jgi:hypothetical protein
VFCGLLAFACTSVAAVELAHPDHAEFDATLEAPYRPIANHWPIALNFDYPFAGRKTAAAWTLEATAADGRVVREWIGITPLQAAHARVELDWNGLDEHGMRVTSGYYSLHLRVAPTVGIDHDARLGVEQQIAEAFATFAEEIREQALDVVVGDVAPDRIKPIEPLAVGVNGAVGKSAGATGGLPYTIYYGNFHSQTNHSDGGAPVASCGGAESPQAGVYGPADAYAMMQDQAGGDFLLASEHNHMYDGSTGTNSSAIPTTAIDLFQSGRQAASAYSVAHPSFLALYGLEWGVISNGGHLNLLNVDALAEWEYNGSNQLIGEVYTPKSDYASLYQTMNSRGWIGMFNHPATSGQFKIGSTSLAYDANGDQVMVMAEVLNSSAFSTNTTQTESSRSSYVGAWNTLLERGYHVAPASDQDNHCANWGLSFTNRTGVLIPNGTTLNTSNFFDALRARRVFATEDKAGQLILTGNDHVMGERFASSGTLTLVANYSSTNGQSVQRVQYFHGVPGRNGTVSQLAEGSATYAFTPPSGEHFYYALLTQSNGLRLWSAPLWVSQGSGGDTQAPTVAASESGGSGTITLSASASDNVGVIRVEFRVDGALKGSDTSTPYSMTLDSSTLSNGSHSLIATAFDAAGNSASSTAVMFSINNSTSVERIIDGGFESGSSSWIATSGVVTDSSSYAAHGGSWKAWLDGYGSTHTDTVYQTVSIPSTVSNATLSFWLRVDTDETTTTTAYDTLKVQLRSTGNSVLTTPGSWSNLDAGGSYVHRTFDVSAYKGQTVRIYFEGKEDSTLATSFLVDDVSLTTY